VHSKAKYQPEGPLRVNLRRARVAPARPLNHKWPPWQAPPRAAAGRITNAARKISTVGGSLRDIQALAGHSNLSTTQRYIESHGEAQRKIVELV
jgi:hypothetical protein